MGASRHLLALLIAAWAAWALQAHPVAGWAIRWLGNRDFFQTYTPYFPGMAQISTHRIFSKSAASEKKIVLLGASAVDSIGCDYTWHRPEKGVEPNVHWSCSIAAQLERMLPQQGYSDWRVYNLARNGSHLTDMLFVYSQIAALKPDLVIFGDSFNYYMWQNADADGLSAAQYAEMGNFYGNDPRTRDVWLAYLANLKAHGWTGNADAPSTPSPAPSEQPPPKPRLGALIERGFINLRHAAWAEGMPRPLAFVPYRDWTEPRFAPHLFENPDPGFKYLQGVTLIASKQREFGGKTFFYYSPQWDSSHDPVYVEGVDRVFGGYLTSQGIPYISMIGMRMQSITETYDGNHNSLLGNRRIAATLLQGLREKGMISE